jgi:hypothetical protein
VEVSSTPAQSCWSACKQAANLHTCMQLVAATGCFFLPPGVVRNSALIVVPETGRCLARARN